MIIKINSNQRLQRLRFHFEKSDEAYGRPSLKREDPLTNTVSCIGVLSTNLYLRVAHHFLVYCFGYPRIFKINFVSVPNQIVKSRSSTDWAANGGDFNKWWKNKWYWSNSFSFKSNATKWRLQDTDYGGLIFISWGRAPSLEVTNNDSVNNATNKIAIPSKKSKSQTHLHVLPVLYFKTVRIKKVQKTLNAPCKSAVWMYLKSPYYISQTTSTLNRPRSHCWEKLENWRKSR